MFEKYFNKRIWLFIAISILLYIIPLTIYLCNFDSFKFSSVSSEWGDFGSYFSGVLSPFFAIINILIFIYISYLLTIINKKQYQRSIDSEKDIFIKGNLYKVHNDITNSISQIFDKEKPIDASSFKQNVTLLQQYYLLFFKDTEYSKILDALIVNGERIIEYISKQTGLGNDYEEKSEFSDLKEKLYINIKEFNNLIK